MQKPDITPENLEAHLNKLEPRLMAQVPDSAKEQCLNGACEALQSNARSQSR